MSGGSGSTAVSNTAPPQQFMDAYTSLLNRGTAVANQPRQTYTGEQVAQFTPDQQAAFEKIRTAQGAGQPYFDKAGSYLDAATKDIWGGLPQLNPGQVTGSANNGLDYLTQAGNTDVRGAGATGIAAAMAGANNDPSDVSRYFSPFVDEVVNATQAQFDNQNMRDKLALRGDQAKRGAWGGDRTNVAEANLMNQLTLAQAPVIANLRNSGYQTAMSQKQQQDALRSSTGIAAATLGQQGAVAEGQLRQGAGTSLVDFFKGQQDQQRGANETNAWLNAQAGFGNANLGKSAQDSRYTDISTLLQSGGLQQALNQANLNVPFADWQQEQAWPFQTTNFLSGLTTGLGGAAGGTGTSTTEMSPISTAVGLGTTGLALNKMGAFDWGGSSGGSSGIFDWFGSGASYGNGGDYGASDFFGTARGGAIPSRARGGIADAVNDNEYPAPQRRTGTGGIARYDDGGDVLDEEDPVWDIRPTARPTLTTDGGIAGPQAPVMPGTGIAPGPSRADRYKPVYEAPSATGGPRAAQAAEIRKDAPAMALLTAGLGILGSGNIGAGAMKGVGYYADQQKQARGIDEKAAEAADTGKFRFADLDLQGKRFSDMADEAAERLRQGDSHFQTTEARQSKEHEDQMALDRAKLVEQRRYHTMSLGTDDSGKPVDLARAVDANSKSILAQTGLTMPGFLVLTGQASKLPRDKASRTRAFQEAENFANKAGVDVSTFASQYDANTETLQSNIKRANMTKVMEDELAGTIKTLKPVADAAKLGQLRVANVAKMFAGQEVNDPVIQNYRFNLNQLKTELAAYSAATQGRGGNSITMQDYHEAEQVIKDGLSSKGADGLNAAVHAATGKMNSVMARNIRSSNKAVWNLFGVGQNFDKLYPTDEGGDHGESGKGGGGGGGGGAMREGSTLVQGGNKFVVRDGKPVYVGPAN